ncbi:MAG: alpha-1,4-glucan--maltose-1-phosphate maltosyltransferase [Calditrichaceae bacterium]
MENLYPEIDGGIYPIKRIAGEKVQVSANVFADGHDEVVALLLYRKASEKDWREKIMTPGINDRWTAQFSINEEIDYYYTVEGYIDHFITWKKALKKKWDAKQDVKTELQIGIQLIEQAVEKSKGADKTALNNHIKKLNSTNTESAVEAALGSQLEGLMRIYPDKAGSRVYPNDLRVCVERPRALFSAWYELFPRSWSEKPGKHGTFKDVHRLLPEIARMGFDIVYLPPIHPIGRKNRKGKNNSTTPGPGDPGSPWAIGSDEGGHKDVHPQLGTIEDFRSLLKKAREYNIEIAMDIALQCAPDHPYVKEHPDWFKWRPDGTVQYAENPPKRYEDILPINFDTRDWKNLWEELKSIFLYWIEQGVRIFRVDNPHTKPYVFWDWLIREVKKDYPDTLFLAEAFARPNVMYRLAKGGFSQSYTYFTWRNTEAELKAYINELKNSEITEYFRPNFWPNTPDILPEHLQYGHRPVFIMRLVLAATLCSNFGIYGPAFELCVSEAVPGKEEYLNSEKYEIKKWHWDQEGNIKDVIARVNEIRRENQALHTFKHVYFCEVDNDQIIAYVHTNPDLTNIILVVVNLDPYHTQSGRVRLPLVKLGISADRSFLADDLLGGDKYIWQNESNYVELDPNVSPAHIIKIRRHLKRESDFDYYM